jgi:hypothetical protein
MYLAVTHCGVLNFYKGATMKQAEPFKTFHLCTDEAVDSPVVKTIVERFTFCKNFDRPEEEIREDKYIEEWAEAAVCLIHHDDSHRIILHCGVTPIYDRYRKPA